MAATVAATFESFDGTAISYSTEGDGPLVVMLHGFASDGESNWRGTGIGPAVARAGFRVVLPDARGHGRSGKPHDVDAYRLPAMARDVSALLDHLDAPSAHLVGYSLGSTTAITVASLDDRIGKLVLGGAGATLLRAGSESMQRLRLLGAAALELDDASALTEPAAIALRSFVERGGGDRLALAAAERAEEGLPPDALLVTNPTLVLTGRDDGSAGAPEALASVLPNATAGHLAGDHLAAVRDPSFPERIIRFLADATTSLS